LSDGAWPILLPNANSRNQFHAESLRAACCALRQRNTKKAASNTPKPGSLNKEFELRLALTSFNAHSTNQIDPASHPNQ